MNEIWVARELRKDRLHGNATAKPLRPFAMRDEHFGHPTRSDTPLKAVRSDALAAAKQHASRIAERAVPTYSRWREVFLDSLQTLAYKRRLIPR